MMFFFMGIEEAPAGVAAPAGAEEMDSNPFSSYSVAEKEAFAKHIWKSLADILGAQEGCTVRIKSFRRKGATDD